MAEQNFQLPLCVCLLLTLRARVKRNPLVTVKIRVAGLSWACNKYIYIYMYRRDRFYLSAHLFCLTVALLSWRLPCTRTFTQEFKCLSNSAITIFKHNKFDFNFFECCKKLALNKVYYEICYVFFYTDNLLFASDYRNVALNFELINGGDFCTNAPKKTKVLS